MRIFRSEAVGVQWVKFDEGGFLFSGGFFLSGYSNGQMWSNAVASASLVEDYLPGKVGSEVKDPLNSIYVVNKRDPAFSLFVAESGKMQFHLVQNFMMVMVMEFIIQLIKTGTVPGI